MKGHRLPSRSAQRDRLPFHVRDFGNVARLKLLRPLDEADLLARLVMSDEFFLGIGPAERMIHAPFFFLTGDDAFFFSCSLSVSVTAAISPQVGETSSTVLPASVACR